ncbi:MAG: M28 family metallopeptidase [Bacteroidota bacterium]
MKYIIYLLLLAVAWTACETNSTASDTETAQIQIDSAAVEQHLATLASDEFEGRKPFSAGEEKTVDYLVNAFKDMGLQPGNGDSYIQEVPLVEITGTPETEIALIKGADQMIFKQGKQIVTYTEKVEERVEVNDAELVFCGYGIVAPEYGWNDYEGIDMTGKIAVVMVNDPGFENEVDSTIFKGNTMTYYGRWTYKYEEAARQGAAGCLIIHEQRAAGYPWFVVQSSWTGGKLNLESELPKCNIQGWITLQATSDLFKFANTGERGFFEKARSTDFEPIPLGVTISTYVENEMKRDVSKNVIAMLPAKEESDEYVIYSSHWDHLGIGQPVNGDSIYNGALDNASGTASMLGIAEAFTQLPEAPSRNVVFLAVTAEEQGLLGSAYYAENPIFPPAQTVANLNIDGVNFYGATNDLSIVGYGQSTMDDLTEEEAKKQGRYVTPDAQPEKGFFFRSDQFSFAKIGIPVLYIDSGLDHKEKGKAYSKDQLDKYTAERYHRPADHYTPGEWDLSGMVADALLFFNIGYRIADSDIYPEWKDGSEFKSKREVLKD